MKTVAKRAAAAVLAALLLSGAFLGAATAVAAEKGPELSGAECALLIEASTGKVILEKDADKQTEFAGLVRLPALLAVCLAFDGGEIFENSVVTVTERAASIKGATAFIAPNERITAGLLLKAAVMLNAGDAVCALTEAVYPSPAAASEAVTELLRGMGMVKQIDDALCSGASFSANEIAAVCRRLLTSPSFLKYSSIYTDTLPHEAAGATELVNPNRLVRHYSGCFGLATGSVGSNDYCGAFAARRGSTLLLAINAGMSTSESRFTLGRDLLDYGFSAFRTVELLDAGEAVAVLPVKGGVLESVSVVTGSGASALMPVGNAKAVSRAELPEYVEAPVAEGQKLGELVISDADGAEVGRAPLTAAHAVEKAGYGDYFGMMARDWIGL